MKIRLFSILIALLIILPHCRPKTDCQKLYNDFESGFASGNFTIANKLADSLNKFCTDDIYLLRKTAYGIQQRSGDDCQTQAYTAGG